MALDFLSLLSICHPDLAFIGEKYSLYICGLSADLSPQWEPELKPMHFKCETQRKQNSFGAASNAL